MSVRDAALALIRDIDAAKATQYEGLDPDRAVMAMVVEAQRADRSHDALPIALSAHAELDSYFTAAALGSLHRSLGDLVSAERAWRRATEHRPDDIGVRLDWADALVDHQRPELALPLYDDVLRVQFGHPWAEPSAMYCRWAAKPGLAGRLALAGYARTQPDNRRAAELAARAAPFVGWLPPPQEACIAGLQQIAEPLRQAAQDGEGSFSMTLPVLEAPSAVWACTTEVWRHQAQLTTTADAIARPDLRQPRWAAGHRLWEWSGTDAQPALGPPDDRAASAISAVASAPFDRGAWFREGSMLRQQHGVESLLSVMLQPPPGPAGYPGWLWLQRVQVAAALALAADPEPWAGSERRDALHSLLAVRNDWLTTAAIIAVTQLALVDPSSGTEIRQWLSAVLAEAPDQGHWTVAHALYCSLLELGVDGEARRGLMDALREIEGA